MLTVHHSNRTETLLNKLAYTLLDQPSPVFEPETIVIQSNGMQRWVNMRLADALGTAANIAYPYPAAFLWDIYRSVLPNLPEQSSYAKPVLSWRMLEVCAVHANKPGFEELAAYWNRADELGRYQLAFRLADTFDQYLVYRPELITAWEQGEEHHWQARLWRELSTQSTDHRVNLQSRFHEAFTELSQKPDSLPARISIFGVSTLPPAYLEVLGDCASFIDIDLYLLNPCQQFWGLIETEKTIAKKSGKEDPEALYLETGNRLLASMGRQGRDFHHLILELGTESSELFGGVDEDSLLHCIQSDILDLHNRGANHVVCEQDTLTTPLDQTAMDESDDSIRVHVCHSATREVEVLHDQLLDMLQRDPNLQPSDIIVMTPDIETYAPCVQAVFGNAQGRRYLPYTVADRSTRAESPVAEAFIRLLDMPGGRYPADLVASLLELPPIRERFGIEESDIDLIHRWIRESGIRWGMDAAHREKLGLPAEAAHTWRAGLDRLILGYAMPGNNQNLYEGILPYDDIEGDNARLLGRFSEMLTRLFNLEKRLSGERNVADWAAMLGTIIDDFLSVDEDREYEIQTLRDTFEQFSDSANQAEFTRKIGFPVVRDWVTRALESASGIDAFLGGGITFCAMVPMRSIPFRVICLIGLNDGIYPRTRPAPDFDLIAANPKRGDRSSRNDDRYLFLESLFSAREKIYLSYVGQSIKDNSEIPPSVLLGELLDYIKAGFFNKSNPEADVLENVVVEHPLHAFSAKYFSADSPLFSYAEERVPAATSLSSFKEAPQLFDKRLSDPTAEFREVSIEALCAFYANTSRYLLQNRLAVRLPEGEAILENSEPFDLSDFRDTRLRERILELRESNSNVARIIKAEMLLPSGSAGDAQYLQEERHTEQVMGKLAALDVGEKLENTPIDIELGEFKLIGNLSNLHETGLVSFTTSKFYSRYYMDVWIRHLILNIKNPESIQRSSIHIALDDAIQYVPVSEAHQHLRDLLEAYWEGLHSPLPFFARSSTAWAKTDPSKDQLAAARMKWKGNDFTFGECNDAHHKLIYGERDPIGPNFVATTKSLLLPAFAHLGDV